MSLNLSKENLVFYSLLLFLPTQLGLHFWPRFSYVQGIRIDYLSPTIYITDILVGLLIIIAIKNKRIKLPSNIYFKAFLILVFLGVLMSQNFGVGVYGLVKLTEFILLGIYTSNQVKISSTFLGVFSVGVLFESLLAIAQFLHRGSLGFFYLLGERSFNSQTLNIANANIGGELILRPYATFSHPNVLAAYLLFEISFILFFSKPKEKIEKIFFYSVLLVGSIALALTLSRIAILVFLLVAVFKLLQVVALKSFKAILPLAILIAVPFLSLLPFSVRFTNFALSDESFVQREQLFRASLSLIKDHPLFGVGLNNFLVSLPNYYTPTKTFFYLQPVHNIFLLIFAQVGILAGLAFIFFLIKLFRKVDYKMKILLFISVALGFFDHYFLTLQQGQLLLTLVLGLCFSEVRRKRNLVE